MKQTQNRWPREKTKQRQKHEEIKTERFSCGRWNPWIHTKWQLERVAKKIADMILLRLITLFPEHFTLTKNFYQYYHSLSNFSTVKQEQNQTFAQNWKEPCQVEIDCIFENITQAEIEVSIFNTSATDTKLRNKNLNERGTTVKLVTDRIR